MLTRDLSRGHIIDFNPYAVRTDALLFEYEELLAILVENRSSAPELRVIDSKTHPAVTRNAPEHQHNMIPFEALSLSSGMDIEQFKESFHEEIEKALAD